MTLEIVRKLLIGFMIGGGIGAKLGAYISQISGVNESWNLIEYGIVMGSVVGICVSGAVALYKSEYLKSSDKVAYPSNPKVLVSQ